MGIECQILEVVEEALHSEASLIRARKAEIIKASQQVTLHALKYPEIIDFIEDCDAFESNRQGLAGYEVSRIVEPRQEYFDVKGPQKRILCRSAETFWVFRQQIVLADHPDYNIGKNKVYFSPTENGMSMNMPSNTKTAENISSDILTANTLGLAGYSLEKLLPNGRGVYELYKRSVEAVEDETARISYAYPAFQECHQGRLW